MLKCLILLSFIGLAFGQWQFNSYKVYENGGSDEFVDDLETKIMDAGKYTSLTFELFGEHAMFKMEGTKLLTKGPLDRETKDFYNITVKTLNNGERIEELSPKQITIKVGDVNDNSPVIDEEQTKFYVSENIETGDKVFHVEASDKDEGANAKLHYLLNCTRDVTDDDVTNDCPLVIHQNGDVTLSSRLDREARDEYKVVVTVTDCVGCPSHIKRRKDQSEFFISVEDENDNAPYFDWSVETVEVAENATYNTELLKLNAKDKDLGENSEMTYQLLNNEDEIFFVDNKGVLRVKQSLDYEKRDEYNLVVKVSNKKALVQGAKTSNHDEANIKIKVLDVNEPPVLLEDSKSVQVSEGAAVGRKIAKLNAKDPERDAFNFEGSSKYFSVNSNGDVVLKSQLNYESEKQHELQVTLKDKSNGNNENTEIVFVQVLDVNDNVPKPLNESRVLTLCQNNHNASQVLKGVLKASDEDSLDVNGNLFTFSQDPTDQTYNGNFQLFNRDGQGYIRTVRGDFDKSVTDKFTLSYVISDNGNPTFKATYNVEVNVCECGENGNCVTSGLYKSGGSGSVNTIVVACCVLLAVVLIVLSAFFYQRSRRDKEMNKSLIHEAECSDLSWPLEAIEGGGEEDNAEWDLRALRDGVLMVREPPVAGSHAQTSPPKVDTQLIDECKQNTDDDPNNLPYDAIQVYEYEGIEGSRAGSLSSLESSGVRSRDQDYDYLKEWGPKFGQVKKVYGQ